MAKKAKHAFGNSSQVVKALQEGKIDAYDILFLDGDTEPKIGWIDANGEFRLVKNEADFSELEEVIAKKANIEDVEALEDRVDTKINEVSESAVVSANAYTDKMVEAAIGEHLVKKYEITDVPDGTLVDYRESEIRIFCPESVVWKKQNVGVGGDPNCYYATFKTYLPNDEVVGYKEHLGNQSDAEIQTAISTDEYGRRYQSTWLALAKYDETTDTWTYYGKNSSEEKYIGWDYTIQMFNADGLMIASNNIRINLSNENCHSSTKPYYVGGMMKDIQEMVDEKIEEVNSIYEIVEF